MNGTLVHSQEPPLSPQELGQLFDYFVKSAVRRQAVPPPESGPKTATL